MRKILGYYLAIMLFFSVFAHISAADDMTELKEQIKMMQGRIEEQSKQIVEMRSKLEKLEKGTVADKQTPAGVEQRVSDLEQKVSGPGTLKSYWKEGLKFSDDKGNFSLAVGGRLMADTGWMQEESAMIGAAGKASDQAEFRRARLFASGTVYDNVIFVTEYDFAGGDADFKDVYIGVKDIPYAGTVKAGHIKQPFCLDELTSSKYITFMETSLVTALIPGYDVGLGANSTLFDDRMTWALSLYRDADGYGTVSSNEYNMAARITGLPWYEDDGEKLLHLGLAYSFQDPEESKQYHAKPENNMAPYFADTGSFDVHHVNLLGCEASAVLGPLSMQGELVQSFVEEEGGEDTYFYGASAQVSYFLTGEYRPYSRSAGVFSRVKPKENFSIKDKTWGAWELAARYSHLDLKDNGIDGGILSDSTLGLNWYLNPTTRIMANYIHSHLNGVGNADAFLTRIQIDF
ncbi:MAG: porin [Candidatus Omnitrophota bacterium]|nr:porin [Candidatus Omnitrophota bacterium]